MSLFAMATAYVSASYPEKETYPQEPRWQRSPRALTQITDMEPELTAQELYLQQECERFLADALLIFSTDPDRLGGADRRMCEYVLEKNAARR